MSGGHWGFENDTVGREIFGWDVDIAYGLDSTEHKIDAKKVHEKNVLEDKEISELVFDVFCLLHSYDWYESGDRDEVNYRADVKVFKEKWLGKPQEQRVKDEIDKSLSEAKDQLYRDLLNKSKG